MVEQTLSEMEKLFKALQDQKDNYAKEIKNMQEQIKELQNQKVAAQNESPLVNQLRVERAADNNKFLIAENKDLKE